MRSRPWRLVSISVFQKDRLKPVARHHGVLHMLDRRIHAVQPPRGASYHPKLALVRYLGPGDVVTWKLWLGSRNLTGGQDREAGLLLIGRVGGKSGKRMPSVAAMARDLLEPALWISGYAAELASARWRAPDGVTLRCFHWRRAGERKPFNAALRGATRTVAISPFVDDAGCTAFDDCPASLLLTTGEAAANLEPRSDVTVTVCRPPMFDMAMPVEPPAAPPAVDEVSVPEPAGLHAKLLLREKGVTNRLWIGSANLTRRGMDGPNAELMAELDVPADVAKALTAYVEDGAPFERASVELDFELTSRRAAERALDDAVAAVVGADMELSRDWEGLRLTSSTSFHDFLSGHCLEAWLLTRPDAVAAWLSDARSVLLVPGGVPLKFETVLVCFRAERLQEDCPPRTWAQAVRFPGHDAEARDRAATAAYIGLAGASAWVRAQLEGIVAAEATTWTGARRWAGSEFAGAGDELPLALEEVLAAWARDPDEFEARARRLEETLTALGAELAQVPVGERDEAALARWVEIETFWAGIRAAIGEHA